MTTDQPPECRAATEALSALLDGEDPGLSQAWLTEHLVACGECRAWYDAARELRRRARLRVAEPAPDGLVSSVMTRLTGDPAETVPTARSRWNRIRLRDSWARLALLTVALLQLAYALPILLFARDSDVSVHPAHELGSFDVALAVGLLYAAWRPRSAHAVRPIVGATAVLLLATAALDLLHGGRTTLGDEAPHLLSLAGFLALCFVRGEPAPSATRIADTPDRGESERGPALSVAELGPARRPLAGSGDQSALESEPAGEGHVPAARRTA